MDRQTALLDALAYLDPDSLSYDEWIRVGMALKAEGLESYYDPWSRKGAKYKPGEPNQKLKSFDGTEVTGNTIFRFAQDRGWHNPGKAPTAHIAPPAEAKEDTGIERLRKILKAHNTTDAQVAAPAQHWENDLITYLRTLYHDTDIVTITSEAERDGTRWRPKGVGKSYLVADLIMMVSGFSPAEILHCNREAGAWIRINPTDGNGCKDINVADFRYTLIESDDLPLTVQLSLIHELQLPVAALVHSGGKSIHAVVRVGAGNAEQYEQRVRFLHDICKRYGFSVDAANKNPSRLTRLPGVERGDGKQYLIDTDIGCSDFTEWENMIRKGLFGIEVLSNALAKPLPLRPALIEGVLRTGHKMMVASSSKAGKTFLMMSLALSVATGRPWLGFPCMKGKILYLNMEIDTASAENRFHELCRAMRINDIPKNIDLMNLRSESAPLDQLANRIIEVVKGLNENYLCIIVDPFYKVLTGDENSNTDMAQMSKSADLITEETGASLIYVHHFSKGRQYNKQAIDRASGAGTFGRDADALVTLTAYDEQTTDGDTVLEAEFVTREFRRPEPMMVRFEYPLFEVVSRSEYPEASMEKKGNTAGERAGMYAKVREAYLQCNEVTADSGQRGIHKKALMDQIQKMYPDLIPTGLTPGQLRSKEKLLIEQNSDLKYVGKDGKNAVFRMSSSSL